MSAFKEIETKLTGHDFKCGALITKVSNFSSLMDMAKNSCRSAHSVYKAFQIIGIMQQL